MWGLRRLLDQMLERLLGLQPVSKRAQLHQQPNDRHRALAQHPLIESGNGVAFEGAAFQEMILFIEDLPR
ncbi:hypothetical protein BXU08_19065 [Sphingomonas sp. LM7]|nr:hypothetical protein BXU08_19065 [Sphingomonas sp. LM7]